MAKLTALPEQHIIDGFKKTIDFYVWEGIPCARKWPQSPGHHRAPDVEAQWVPFTYINQIAAILPSNIIEAYKRMAVSSNVSWKDILTRAYIAGIEGIKALNPFPLVPLGVDYFTITQFLQTKLPTGWKIVLTTDTSCNMLLFWTDREPKKTFVYRERRGVSILAMAQFHFVYVRPKWQREPTDSYTHTFYFISMPDDQTRWFGAIGFKNRWLCRSTTPVLHKTKEHGWNWPVIVEQWDNPYILPPHMAEVIRESWHAAPPLNWTKLITESWFNSYLNPPTFAMLFSEDWSIAINPPPLTQLLLETWSNPFINPPIYDKMLTETWTAS